MIGTNTSIERNADTAGALRRGVRRTLSDAADAGFGVSQQHVPHGADSHLANSGYPPEEQPDGSWEWGYSADYAAAVEDGSVPHWIPLRAMPDLKRWARRVLGDEGAAWAVRSKIATEGTEAQPYVGPGVEAQRAHLQAHGVGANVEREL